MEDQVTRSQASAEQLETEKTGTTLTEESPVAGTVPEAERPAAERTDREHKQAYGTAKTENLRDSGLWRLLLPAFILVCCLTVLAVPLIILIPLLYGALVSNPSADIASIHAQLVWLWIAMIALEVGIAAVIIRYFLKTFFSQSYSYRK